jgi:hypothetical protein
MHTASRPSASSSKVLALLVEGAHPHGLGAADLVVDAGHRQAPFLTDLLAGSGDDLGVDQGQQGRFVFGDVDDHDAADVHLGGSKTDARRLVHGFRHVGDQLTDFVIHLARRRCAGGAWVGVAENR